MKDKCPRLRQRMLDNRSLGEFLMEQAEQINAEVGNAVARTNAKMAGRPWLEKVQAMNNVDQEAMEVALSQAVEALPDEISSPSLG
jgi:arginyl-tRNA--protein-N-Asp/Glu arginylyltransferase